MIFNIKMSTNYSDKSSNFAQTFSVPRETQNIHNDSSTKSALFYDHDLDSVDLNPEIKVETEEFNLETDIKVETEEFNLETEIKVETEEFNLETEIKVETEEFNTDGFITASSNNETNVGIVETEVKQEIDDADMREKHIDFLADEKMCATERDPLLIESEQTNKLITESWPCKVCNKKYLSQESLKKHVTTHFGKISYKCSSCNKSFDNEKIIRLHLEICNSGKEIKNTFVKTVQIDKVYNKTQQENAVTSITQNDPILQSTNIFECHVCKMDLFSQENLMEHQKEHISMNIRVVDRKKNVNTYKCPKCDFVSTRYNNVMRHVAQVHEAVGPKESVEQLYECCLCEDLFISENNLKLHQKEKCSKRGFSECHVCNKVFASKSSLREHLGLHLKRKSETTSTSNDSSTLSSCNKKLKTKSASYKPSNSVFWCHVCNQILSSKRSLELHLQNKHPEESSGHQALPTILPDDALFSCNLCYVVFRELKELKAHQHSCKKSVPSQRTKMSVVNYGNKAPQQQNAISALYQKVRLENESKGESGKVPAGISSSGLRMSLENKSEDENGKVANGISSSGPRVSLQNKSKDENGKVPNEISASGLQFIAMCNLCCYLCFAVFTELPDFKAHQRSCKVSAPKTSSGYYKCKTCDRQYKHLHRMVQHTKEHSHPYKCSKCGEAFAHANSLKEHFKNHEKQLKEEFTTRSEYSVCDQCFVVFKDVEKMKRHKQIHHKS